MKRFAGLFSAILMVGWSGIAAGNSAPVVSNIAVSQRADVTKLVDIYYRLSDADGDECTITLEISNDSGSTWTIPTASSTGDIGSGVRPGSGLHIVWDPKVDAPGQTGCSFKVRITADDGYQPPVGPDMVQIPGGTFQMGDNLGDGWSDELPVHTVTVDSFYMGRCEVTNRQYCDYLNSANSQGFITVTSGVVYKAGSGTTYLYCDTSTSSSYSQIAYSGGVFSVRTKNGRDMSNDPMVRVSWYGAAAYCNWRSQQGGKEQCYNLSTWNCDFSKHGYRLATEAEWEYAARGGLSGRRFPWGDTISHSQANYYSYWSGGHPYYPYDVNPTQGYHPTWDDVYPYTSPGGSFAANGYGLYDMAGNVWEWCNDWWESDYYDYSPANNPTGPITGSYRVLRGGCWFSDAYLCRVAARLWPAYRYYPIGFRCVLDF